jgi:sigma-B regulation protein RsbU (phosphoserine phosphatase)
MVGGDYFDFFEVDETHLGLVIADVSGKGIPGALIMAMVRAVLRAEARGNLSPKEVLRRVNERMVADTKENVFTTMTYGILDIETGKLRFVRAGHEPLLILGNQENGSRHRHVEQLTPEGIALGLISGELFDHNEEADVQLQAGEVAMLYTDGVIEAMDQGSREYGRERLIGTLKGVENPTAQSLIQSIVDDIHQFTLGIPQHDDLTLLALRRLSPEEVEQGRIAARRSA